MIGLGDIAYWLFRPAVYVIDWTWGTDLKDCDKCKARRKRWNAWISAPWWVAFIIFVTIFALVILWRREQ